jgi:hypothetical protein
MANGTIAAGAAPDDRLAAPRICAKVGRDAWIMRGLMAGIALFLIVAVVLPLYAILSKSVQDREGASSGWPTSRTISRRRHRGHLDGHRDHARLSLRLCPDPQLHALQGLLPAVA